MDPELQKIKEHKAELIRTYSTFSATTIGYIIRYILIEIKGVSKSNLEGLETFVLHDLNSKNRRMRYLARKAVRDLTAHTNRPDIKDQLLVDVQHLAKQIKNRTKKQPVKPFWWRQK